MGSATTPLAARHLKEKYSRLSRQGHFGGTAELQELSRLCNALLEGTPDRIRVVAFVLKAFFEGAASQADFLLADSASKNLWPKLDAAILEAIAYLETGTGPADAIRIASTLITHGRTWLGA